MFSVSSGGKTSDDFIKFKIHETTQLSVNLLTIKPGSVTQKDK